jgi:glycosyltransferase involved in cell wall biosynthesis
VFNQNFSVVITTCDRHDEVNRSINSVIKHAINFSELIVVDNGSKPSNIECTDPRIRHIRTRSFIGSQLARNIGVSVCQSDWVLFLDDDDELCFDIQNIRNFKLGIEAILSSSIVCKQGQGITYRCVNQNSFSDSLLVNNPFTFSGTLVRVNFFLRIGCMRQSFKSLQDWDLWLRMYPFKNSILINSEVISKINIGNQTRISTSNNFYISYRRLVLSNMGFFLSKMINPIHIRISCVVAFRLIKSIFTKNL